jgi:hypothetical protein
MGRSCDPTHMLIQSTHSHIKKRLLTASAAKMPLSLPCKLINSENNFLQQELAVLTINLKS